MLWFPCSPLTGLRWRNYKKDSYSWVSLRKRRTHTRNTPASRAFDIQHLLPLITNLFPTLSFRPHSFSWNLAKRSLVIVCSYCLCFQCESVGSATRFRQAKASDILLRQFRKVLFFQVVVGKGHEGGVHESILRKSSETFTAFSAMKREELPVYRR